MASAAFTLRAATPADIPALHRLMHDFAVYEKLQDRFRITEAELHDALLGTKPALESMLAEADGKPVGFALWYFFFGTFSGRYTLFVEDVFVAQPYRGHRIGLALFRHMARAAQQRDCIEMKWDVLDWNAPAIEFYRRLGARPMDEWTTFRLTGDALTRLAEDGSAGPATT